MSVEVRPLGVQCNIACQYCYQHPQRDAGPAAPRYDMAKMQEALLREGRPFAVFGGEPLLVPADDLEELFRFGLERFGYSMIQTNGTLLSDRHIELFHRYRVRVGVSIDGPGPLNDARWTGTLGKTRQATHATEEALGRLCQAGLNPTVIVTLHRLNAAEPRLPELGRWLADLSASGVKGARLHVLEVESERIREAYALTPEETLAAFLYCAALEEQLPPGFLDVFKEIERLMHGEDHRTSCVWRGCDPYTTAAVRGVEGNGERSNCGRTNKEGVSFIKGGRVGFERYIALYQTPQSEGGCRDCRFFLLCKGHCPGTALDDDWRNRTENCETWKKLFAHLEQRIEAHGGTPLSSHRQRRAWEQAMLAEWRQGSNPDLHSFVDLSSPAAPSTEPSDSSSFSMPFFTRMVWVSDEAKRTWEARIGFIRKALAAADPPAPDVAPEKEQEPIWELALRLCPDPQAITSTIELTGEAQVLNPLLRPMGFSLLPGGVCSPACTCCKARGEQLLSERRAAGFETEMKWLSELLGAPMEWTALHGIAELKTPLFKLMHDTPYTPRKLTVRWKGTAWPQFGAAGISFPYRNPAQLRLTDSAAFRRGLEQARSQQECETRSS